VTLLHSSIYLGALIKLTRLEYKLNIYSGS